MSSSNRNLFMELFIFVTVDLFRQGPQLTMEYFNMSRNNEYLLVNVHRYIL